MRFYVCDGIRETKTDEAAKDKGSSRRKNSSAIKLKTDSFNLKNMDGAYVFIADDSEEGTTVGMLINDGTAPEVYLTRFLKALGMTLKEQNTKESTLHTVHDLLKTADRNSYIGDVGAIEERFGLQPLLNYHAGLVYHEQMIADRTDKSIRKAIADDMTDETMFPELDRIADGNACHTAPGHPVHYLLRTDETDIRREMPAVLLSALYARHRLQNRRYTVRTFSYEEIDKTELEALYKISIGGAVVLQYTAGDTSEDEYASTGRENIGTVCDMIKKYRHQVLTVLCLPRECTSLKEMLYEELGSVSMIELYENLADQERADVFLRTLAKKTGVRADKKLLAAVEPEKKYLAAELRAIFDEWYDEKIKTTVFPAYRSCSAIREKTAKKAPKGSAYDELTQMIGLDEAKQVLKQALDHHKAAKLFADKGMKSTVPSMHMVFTGNPGTAKTSVARLFARIMKENGLLSNGRITEVGRGDLVGKYVGWTAQTVQKKFREAQGGVLFIDEAYSLLDDRSGSFGDEAINTIVQEMENHREDVIVIFAGYPDEMERFLQKNPGLSSRIAFHVPFSDYDTDELIRIAELIAKKMGLELSDGAKERLMTVFASEIGKSGFGNGRTARNIIEKASMAHSSRLLRMDCSSVSRKDVRTIDAEDIELPEKEETDYPVRIGFSA